MVCSGCNKAVYKVRFLPDTKEWLCPECSPEARPIQNADPGHFPFVTTHMHPQGKAVEVKSLRHLRKLENKFGVQSEAWN